MSNLFRIQQLKMTSNSSIVILLIVIICNASPIYSESTVKVSKYDIVKMVHDASARISLTENLNKLVDLEIDSLIDELESFSGRNLNPLLTEILRNNGSDKCVEDLLYVFENIVPISGWAAKMVDSYGKPERGILQGNLHWLGDFNECINVYSPPKAAKSNFTVGDFHGQYCTLQMTAHVGNISMPISFDVCLPDSCHLSDEKKQVNSSEQIFMLQIEKGLKSIFTDVKLTCQPKFRTFTTAAICVMFLISIFLMLALVGSLITAYENFAKIKRNRQSISIYGFDNMKTMSVNGRDIDRLSMHGDDDAPIPGYTRKVQILPAWLERCKPFFNCFCVITNGAKLLDTSDSEGQLPCLHGIRFLSLSWVIVCHTYAFSITNIRNVVEIIPAIDNWPFQIILNGFYSVDSFFLLSGFLLAYLFFEVSSKNNGKVPWLYFYIHRYVRLTPVYIIVIGFNTAIYPYLSSGPLWTTPEIDPGCAKNWWRNLLYINNFYDSTDLCVGWTWYLANDMQFFVISPLFLVALWRYPLIGYAILAFFLNATTVINFVLSYQYEMVAGLGNILVSDHPQDFMTGVWLDYFHMLYEKPYTRISPYIVGIALAYYLYIRRQNNCGKNSLVTLSCGWLIASTITLACTFGLYHRDMSLLEISFYNAFNRTCFAGGLAWVIYVCLTGQGGFINSILSFKLFIPLSRLTYCAYLVHPIVMYLYYSSMRSLFDFSHLTLVVLYLGFLVMSYSVALITSLLFESPVIRLDKLVRNKRSKK